VAQSSGWVAMVCWRRSPMVSRTRNGAESGRGVAPGVVEGRDRGTACGRWGLSAVCGAGAVRAGGGESRGYSTFAGSAKRNLLGHVIRSNVTVSNSDSRGAPRDVTAGVPADVTTAGRRHFFRRRRRDARGGQRSSAASGCGGGSTVIFGFFDGFGVELTPIRLHRSPWRLAWMPRSESCRRYRRPHHNSGSVSRFASRLSHQTRTLSDKESSVMFPHTGMTVPPSYGTSLTPGSDLIKSAHDHMRSRRWCSTKSVTATS
jgi:hypothetical protein